MRKSKKVKVQRISGFCDFDIKDLTSYEVHDILVDLHKEINEMKKDDGRVYKKDLDKVQAHLEGAIKLLRAVSEDAFPMIN